MPRRPIVILVTALTWLGWTTCAASGAEVTWFVENSLGMKIAKLPLQPIRPVPSDAAAADPVCFAAWPTRVRDFEVFVRETEYDATSDMLSLGRDGWKARGASWRDPGFPQGPDHPIVGVSYADALEFCRWLTKRERERGLIAQDQCYRLPTDEEWQALVDFVRPWSSCLYAWGDLWPPTEFDGNFAGEEVMEDANWPEGWECIRGTRDAFVGTSPVTWEGGNYGGFHDLSGNVWQWTSTPFRKELNTPELRAQYPFLDSDTDVTGQPSKVIRGGCWNDYLPGLLELNTRGAREPHNRNSGLGFRVVLAPGEVPAD